MQSLEYYQSKLAGLNRAISANNAAQWLADDSRQANIEAVEREITALREAAADDGHPDLEGEGG